MSREKYIQFVCFQDLEGVIITFKKIGFQINWNVSSLKYKNTAKGA